MRPDRTQWYVDFSEKHDSKDGDVSMPDPSDDGNLYGSLVEGGTHSPVLDIDFEAQLIPSTTPGHYHLYLDGLELEWPAFEALIEALAKAGVIQKGYARTSIARKGTFVRKPGVRKEVLAL